MTNLLKQHSHATVPSHWIGQRGVLKGTDETYYLVCLCGRHVTRRQVEFSISFYGMVVCIECQRTMKAGNRWHAHPEHKAEVALTRTCQTCWGKISNGMMASSLEVSSDKDSKSGKRLCRKCLGIKYSTATEKSRLCNLTKTETTIVEERYW